MWGCIAFLIRVVPRVVDSACRWRCSCEGWDRQETQPPAVNSRRAVMSTRVAAEKSHSSRIILSIAGNLWIPTDALRNPVKHISRCNQHTNGSSTREPWKTAT